MSDNGFDGFAEYHPTILGAHGILGRGASMHFWNKLSTGALMRLTLLASLNLLLVRLLPDAVILFHPRFVLSIVSLNLGLSAVMVYSGSLNTSLIGMMAGGLAATIGTIAYAGMDATAFTFGGPFQYLGSLVQVVVNHVLLALPAHGYQGVSARLLHRWVHVFGYLVADVVGLMCIGAGGWLARRLRDAMERRDRWGARPVP